MVQNYAEENSIKLWFHLPYNVMEAGLIEWYNGTVKASLKTDFQSSPEWTKRLLKTLRYLNERPRDGKPSALCVLRMTWASLLRIHIKGNNMQLKPRVGTINSLLLPAPENLELTPWGR